MPIQQTTRASILIFCSVFCVSSHGQNADSFSDDSICLNRCITKFQNSVEVRAIESGIVAKVEVLANDFVERSTIVLELDNQDTTLQMRGAELSLQQAKASLPLFARRIEQRSNERENWQMRIAKLSTIQDSISEVELENACLALSAAQLAELTAMDEERIAKDEIINKHNLLQRLKLRLDHHSLEAPIAGIVSDIAVHEGQLIEAGEIVMCINDIRHMQVDLRLPFARVSRSRLVGNEIRVIPKVIGSNPQPLIGRITSYDPIVTSEGELIAHGLINNETDTSGQWILLHGMEVDVQLAEEISPVN